MPKQSLLELLANQCGCPYLSDLHTQTYRPVLRKVGLRLAAESYSDQEWNDSFTYILGRKADAQTAEEIKRELIHAISEKE